MSNDFNAPSNTHTYKYRPWMLLLNGLVLGISVLFIGLILAYLITSLASLAKFAADYGSVRYLFLCLLIPGVILLGLLILQIILSFAQIFSSTIRVTPEGIENRVWPLRHIRAGWPEVERLGKFMLYDALYLKSYEVIGPSLSHTSLLKFFNLTSNAVVLSTYSGWPNGQLADDLKMYAPQLFENQTASVEPPAPTPEAAGVGITQEQRILAALSHASVLFAGLGIFLPIVIYVTQKKKSAYLAFHALQAIIYQLVGNILALILPFCMAGTALAFTFAAALSGNGDSNTQAPLMIGGMVVLITMILLTVLTVLAFTLYALIGAVWVYQGKDFRYAIIGKRVAKSSKV